VFARVAIFSKSCRGNELNFDTKTFLMSRYFKKKKGQNARFFERRNVKRIEEIVQKIHGEGKVSGDLIYFFSSNFFFFFIKKKKFKKKKKKKKKKTRKAYQTRHRKFLSSVELNLKLFDL